MNTKSNRASNAKTRQASVHRRTSDLSKPEAGLSNYLTLQKSLHIVAAAQTRAQEIGVAVNIAVVDHGANLVAFARMDGAWLEPVSEPRFSAEL